MPYLKESDRDQLKKFNLAGTAGELNYMFTQIVGDYLKLKGMSYATLNDCVGALECAKLELYRRLAAPYEDYKKDVNGEVYPEEFLK